MKQNCTNFLWFVSQCVHFQPTRISVAMRSHAQLALLTLVTKRWAAVLDQTANVLQDILAHHKPGELATVSNYFSFQMNASESMRDKCKFKHTIGHCATTFEITCFTQLDPSC